MVREPFSPVTSDAQLLTHTRPQPVTSRPSICGHRVQLPVDGFERVRRAPVSSSRTSQVRSVPQSGTSAAMPCGIVDAVERRRRKWKKVTAQSHVVLQDERQFVLARLEVGENGVRPLTPAGPCRGCGRLGAIRSLPRRGAGPEPRPHGVMRRRRRKHLDLRGSRAPDHRANARAHPLGCRLSRSRETARPTWRKSIARRGPRQRYRGSQMRTGWGSGPACRRHIDNDAGRRSVCPLL
jgi:hypothetical protein